MKNGEERRALSGVTVVYDSVHHAEKCVHQFLSKWDGEQLCTGDVVRRSSQLDTRRWTWEGMHAS